MNCPICGTAYPVTEPGARVIGRPRINCGAKACKLEARRQKYATRSPEQVEAQRAYDREHSARQRAAKA